MKNKKSAVPRIALALAGGGPLGAIFSNELIDDLGHAIQPSLQSP